MGIHHIKSKLLERAVSVVVVGAGGTGSVVLTGLAQLHTAMLALGHPGGLEVKVIDDDTVSEANVGRQMFFPSDIGMPKASVLVNRINMAMGLDWEADIRRLESHNSYGNVDIVIGCVDNRKARKAILEVFQDAYWLDIGNKLDQGQVILGEIPQGWQKPDPKRLPHAAELFPEIVDETAETDDDGPSCGLADALEKQSLFVNRGVGLFALNLLWELFRHGRVEHHGVFVNLKTSRTSPLAIDPEVWARFGYTPAEPAEARKTA